MVGNGNKVLFCGDIWLLFSGYPILGLVCYHQWIEKYYCKCVGWYKFLTFRCTINHSLFDSWPELIALIQTYQFWEEEDKPVWLFHPSSFIPWNYFVVLWILEEFCQSMFQMSRSYISLVGYIFSHGCFLRINYLLTIIRKQMLMILPVYSATR
jgi:hypothetical protein